MSLAKPIPNEKALVEATLERELERVAYVRERQAICSAARATGTETPSLPSITCRSSALPS